MYTYTPSAGDLLTEYTHIASTEGRSLTQIFQAWSSDIDSDTPAPATDRPRSMMVGDIIVFDGMAYIIRPAGYDPLSIIIP